ncbi:phosphoenolpyruvate synthase [Picrophilus oshimae]|uniref:Phosphoenolpyruvate synthase n=1 Tax=Picrophilus torridus (strain ATCC 700027 / DSM 9790 / JCM 10055 / NBRC 100828 / KAW 2/3) TaxID=1122961 RepID=Q6KYU8_PICTO|nr:phosphoenolpyruvate synthase [Picrophilus oshimae]AAT44104.1 phosphoenolpyruvate synthase [Picrophilus oshimae DSM 9789]
MSEKSKKPVLWLNEVDKNDVSIAGGKAAGLGELMNIPDVHVPEGFVITAYAYKLFLDRNDIEKKINEIIEMLDVDDTRALQRASSEIKSLFVNSKMPDDLFDSIIEHYEDLVQREGAAYVAVRSSANLEDMANASFAGEQETYLNVKGNDQVIEKVKECFASLYSTRAIYYRKKENINERASLSVIIQKQIFSDVSGVMFTLDVSNGDRSKIVIESSYGLGEYIVSGQVTPDTFYVDKNTMKIVKSTVVSKSKMLKALEGGGTMEVSVPETLCEEPSLTDDEVIELAMAGKSIENHYNHPMDIEWAKYQGKLYIVQARFETVWSNREPEEPEKKDYENEVILKGLPASPGFITGRAHVILDVSNIDHFKNDEILITRMTAPDWVPVMKKSRAIITDDGGMTCHAAIVSRELGVPCIVGTSSFGKKATETIKTGDLITVDSRNGLVYRGKVGSETENEVSVEIPEIITGTKVMVNMGEPSIAERIAKLPCDGIGLMREEFIWAEIGEHPLSLLKNNRGDYFVDKLSEYMAQVCRAFNPRPVILRFSDFKTDEYSNLKGGSEFEPVEDNPLLGWRGASRYYDERYREAFKLELMAVRKAREEYRARNLWVMVPFTRTVEEMERIIRIMEDNGLYRGKDFKVFLMAEIPSNILLADKFNKYVDGYSIGSNDLTMLLLGSDRNNGKMSSMFDERDLAVKRAIKYLIKIAHKDKKIVSICGQAPSQYDELVDFLVRAGIDDISVNPDAVIHVKKLVASVEARIKLEAALGHVEIDDDWDLP